MQLAFVGAAFRSSLLPFGLFFMLGFGFPSAFPKGSGADMIFTGVERASSRRSSGSVSLWIQERSWQGQPGIIAGDERCDRQFFSEHTIRPSAVFRRPGPH